LVLLNDNFYKWLRELSNDPHFINTLSITDRLLDEQYNMELALRFLIFKTIKPNEVKTTTDLGEFVTDKMRNLATDKNFNKAQEERDFRRTFELLDYALGDSSFKRYDQAVRKFGGKFLISAFEAVAFGLGKNVDRYVNNELNDKLRDTIKAKVIEIWTNEKFQAKTGSGINVTSRIPIIVPLAERIFAENGK
jgi:hypothetical protein